MEQSDAATLTIEQQFQLEVARGAVGRLTHAQAQAYVVEMMRQMMLKDNLLKHLLKTAP